MVLLWDGAAELRGLLRIALDDAALGTKVCEVAYDEARAPYVVTSMPNGLAESAERRLTTSNRRSVSRADATSA